MRLGQFQNKGSGFLLNKNNMYSLYIGWSFPIVRAQGSGLASVRKAVVTDSRAEIGMSQKMERKPWNNVVEIKVRVYKLHMRTCLISLCPQCLSLGLACSWCSRNICYVMNKSML